MHSDEREFMAMRKLPRVHPREMAELVARRIMIMLEMMMDDGEVLLWWRWVERVILDSADDVPSR